MENILNYFTEISAIPRCSGNEKGLVEWLKKWAEKEGFDFKKDDFLNVCISIEGTQGRENDPVYILQGHLDMVCEKTPGSAHDFSCDPIVPHVEGDWLTAHGTTLGADNGIAIAIAMAIATDSSVSHPPLELLFTSDEETGLGGAMNLSPGFIRGKKLINIDAEEDGFVIGCAGGQDCCLSLPLEKNSIGSGEKKYNLSVSGLAGGHSGTDINSHRGNANQILGRILFELKAAAPKLKLVSLSGGSAHNAIPRDAVCELTVSGENAARAEGAFKNIAAVIREENSQNERTPDMKLISEPIDSDSDISWSPESTARLVEALMTLPHGVFRMSPAIEGKVQTSCNLATLREKDYSLEILLSLRSFSMSELEYFNQRISVMGEALGSVVKSHNPYPSWAPDTESKLLAECSRAYESVLKRKPEIQVIHAGLECGIIGSKYEGMEMIAMGPDIENPHSPDERLYIPSLDRIWKLVKAILAG